MAYTLASASTGTGKNLTSKIDLATYAATADCIVRPYVKLSSLNGAAATITLYARHTTSADATIAEVAFSFPKPTATDTVAGDSIPSCGLYLANGEKVVISALSTNASDTGAAYAIVWVNAAASDVRAWVGTDAVAGAIPAVAAGATGGLADYDTANNAYSEIQLIATGTTVIRANNHTGSNIPDQQEVADALKLAPSGGANATGSVYDTLNAIDPLTAQETADALKLAPAAGSPAAGSVYAKLNAITTIGTGSDTVTLTFTDGTNPISGAEVWVSSDSGGAVIVAGTLTTDDDGEVVMLLDAGTTYYAWLKKSGVNPILGSAFVASAD